MIKKIVFIVGITSLILSCSPSSQVQSGALSNKNVSPDESAVIWQQTAAEYTALCHQAFNIAKKQLEFINNTSKSDMDVIILDIDETILDNSPYNAKLVLEDESYNLATWMDWTSKAEAELVPGAFDFLMFAFELDYKVKFISNRTVEELENTLINLRKFGLSVNESDFLLKEDKSEKTSRRNQIIDQYNIIMLVGDNLADFDLSLIHI